jgi:hypothetical protein
LAASVNHFRNRGTTICHEVGDFAAFLKETGVGGQIMGLTPNHQSMFVLAYWRFATGSAKASRLVERLCRFSAILLQILAMRAQRAYNVNECSKHRKVLQNNVLQCQNDATAMCAKAEYAGLKIRFTQVSVGSSPTFGTLPPSDGQQPTAGRGHFKRYPNGQRL